jgi:hypothetical protein
MCVRTGVSKRREEVAGDPDLVLDATASPDHNVRRLEALIDERLRERRR